MRRAPLVFAMLSVIGGGCGHAKDTSASVESRKCGLTVWHRPASDGARVEVVTGWENWLGAHPTVRTDGGWRVVHLDPPPGEQLYAILEDTTWTTDQNVGTTAFAKIAGVEREVTSVQIADCSVPQLVVEQVTADGSGAATVKAKFLADGAGDAIDPASARATEGDASFPVTVDQGALTITTALAPGKHRLLLSARDVAGHVAESATATVWIEPKPWDWRDAVIYQVVVDRFRGRDGKPVAQPSPASARAGGHVDGVRSAIEDGTFAAMGVNTLWLSPLYANPSGTWPGLDGKSYSSYHGYWPIAPRTLEAAQADEASLAALMQAAHARSMRVLFDVVPNHVHEQHPYVNAHVGDGWFDGTRNADGTWSNACVCGLPGCDWATHELTCWFAPYLPDVDYRNLDASRQFADDVAWWIDRWSGDGVRIDAVPMMPRAATRRMAATIRARWDHPGQRTFVLGETFVGAGQQAALRYFLGPYGLDSEFDFPTMWALRSAFADETAPMSSLDEAIRAGLQAWEGSGAVMSLILGNHDVPRFASVADGDGGDGWSPAPQPVDPNVYVRMGLAYGVLFALPGAPTVYYGDEVGLAGVGDPDQRRAYPADDALSAAQKALRDRVRAMGKARACLPALRRGTYRALAADPERLVFARELDGAATVIVVVSRNAAATLQTPLPGVRGAWVDVLGGPGRTFDSTRSNFDEPPLSVRWYVPAGTACP